MIALLLLCLSVQAGSKAQQRRSESKEQELLLDSAGLYWEAVRWSDADRSAVFIEKLDQRILFKDDLQEEAKKRRLVDVDVLQVVMSPEIEHPPDGRRRVGTVWVRTEGYTMPEQILKNDRVVQRWYRTEAGWFVEWSPDDLPIGGQPDVRPPPAESAPTPKAPQQGLQGRPQDRPQESVRGAPVGG